MADYRVSVRAVEAGEAVWLAGGCDLPTGPRHRCLGVVVGRVAEQPPKGKVPSADEPTAAERQERHSPIVAGVCREFADAFARLRWHMTEGRLLWYVAKGKHCPKGYVLE